MLGQLIATYPPSLAPDGQYYVWVDNEPILVYGVPIQENHERESLMRQLYTRILEIQGENN